MTSPRPRSESSIAPSIHKRGLLDLRHCGDIIRAPELPLCRAHPRSIDLLPRAALHLYVVGRRLGLVAHGAVGVEHVGAQAQLSRLTVTLQLQAQFGDLIR